MSECEFVRLEGEGGEVEFHIQPTELLAMVILINCHDWFVITEIDAPAPESISANACLRIVGGLTTLLQVDAHQFRFGPLPIRLVCPQKQNSNFHLHVDGKQVAGTVRVKWRRMSPEELQGFIPGMYDERTAGPG